MAIDSNLYFANSFLIPVVQYCTVGFEKTWSAEKQIYYTSRLEAIFDNPAKDLKPIQVRPEFMKDFSSTEKEFIYELLRGATINFPKIRFILEDLRNLFKQRGYFNERYLYLESLTDNQFAYELDCKLTEQTKSRRRYYRLLNSKFGKKRLTLKEVLLNYLFTDFVEVNRRRAKRVVRHKGYRDHGSLGSEFSKTLKQQSCDWSIREREEQRQKSRKDFIEFLSGFSGWE